MKKADPGLCECMGSPKPFLTLFFFFAWSWMTWSCEICPHKLSFQCSTAVASGQDLGLFLRCKQFMSVQTSFLGGNGGKPWTHSHSVKRWRSFQILCEEGVMLFSPSSSTTYTNHDPDPWNRLWCGEKMKLSYEKSHQNALGPPGASLLTAALHFYSFENSTFHSTLRWLNPDVDGAKVLLAIIWPKGSTV